MREGSQLPRSALVVWPFLLLLASTCFGIGIGLALVAPVTFFLLLPSSRQRTMLCLGLCALAASMPFIYRGLLSSYEWVAGPTPELLATRMQMSNASLSSDVILMTAFLFARSVSTLLLGFLPAAEQFPNPVAYVAAGMYFIAMAAVFVRGSAVTRRQLLAFLTLAVGCYTIIALGRARLFPMLTLATAAAHPRHHYVGSIPFAIMLCIALERLGAWLPMPGLTRHLLLAGWTATTLVLYQRAPEFINTFPAARKETKLVVDRVRSTIAAAPPGANVYIENQTFASAGPLVGANRPGFPGWAAVYTIFFPGNVVDGKRVYFVDEPAVIAATRKGKRTTDLLITLERSGSGTTSPGAKPAGAGGRDVAPAHDPSGQ